jgi:hypothetical protein
MAQSPWRKHYEAALLQVDLEKLGSFVKAAEDAIHAHAASLNGGGMPDEHNEMEDALRNLRLLKQKPNG